MNALGISGRFRDAAVALAVDGRVVAASSEECFSRVPGIGYSQTGGFPSRAVEACLRGADRGFGDIDEVTVVDGESPGGTADSAWLFELGDQVAARKGRPAPIKTIDALHADAVQTSRCGDEGSAVLVCSTEPLAMSSFVHEEGRLRPYNHAADSLHLLSAARTVATRLGLADRDPYRALDRLGAGAEPEFQGEFAAVMGWHDPVGAAADQLSALIGSIGWQRAGNLTDPTSANQRAQATRRALAASFTCHVATLIREMAERLCSDTGCTSIAFGGAMFANPRLATEIRRLMGGGISLAAVPEAPGRALGAALATSGQAGGRLGGLALGPAFGETEIKQTLDNCRLDYVYEPDWARLLARTSRMLSQGKVIAWFQGPMGFGPRTLGTRSILCDPSGRYVRRNINEYLRHVPVDEALPVVFAPSIGADCLTGPLAGPFSVVDSAIKPEWRDRLLAALDWRGDVRVHAVVPSHASELCELLECHYERTGVPALIETNLCGPEEPTACTPRDAVRTMYSSAVDALLIGRFLLMKDYWLLRNHAD